MPPKRVSLLVEIKVSAGTADQRVGAGIALQYRWACTTVERVVAAQCYFHNGYIGRQQSGVDRGVAQCERHHLRAWCDADRRENQVGVCRRYLELVVVVAELLKLSVTTTWTESLANWLVVAEIEKVEPVWLVRVPLRYHW